MTKLRSVSVAAVFLVGCAVGGGASAFVVPKASAQQAATLTAWEYYCVDRPPVEDGAATEAANRLGAQRWELVEVIEAAKGWCFKRPKM